MITRKQTLLLGVSLAAAAPALATDGTPRQPEIEARAKPVIVVDGLRFKDLNADGMLDPYEDWRLSAEQRAADLVARMTLDEKAGMMLIATSNPACDGSITSDGHNLIANQHMTRFVLRAKVTPTGADCSVVLTGFAARGGYAQTPRRMAEFTNAMQELGEGTRLGIPLLFKDNARNHVETNPLFGIAVDSGSFTEFPKPAGLAAAALGAASPPDAAGTVPANPTADMSVIRDFASVMGLEWRSIGLRGMYGYQVDLGTEPRWSRFHETFSEDADLVSDITTALIGTLQGPMQANGLALSQDTSVSMTLKHFPGGGPQLNGWDAHYTFGKDQVYPDATGRYGFAYQMAPFRAAIAAGIASIMPYYGVPQDVTYDGERLDPVGMAFSRQVVTGLLRERLGFRGNVNSDSGIIQQRGWGFEDFRINPATGQNFTIPDRTAIAIRAGADVLSEFRDKDAIVALVRGGQLDESSDIDPAVTRLLVEQFALGLFEDPYIDAELADQVLGNPAHRALGEDLQRRSVVLLQNATRASGERVLPLMAGSSVYVVGFQPQDLTQLGFDAIDGNTAQGGTRAPVPAGTDVALIKVEIRNSAAASYRSQGAEFGGRPVDAALPLIDPRTGQHQLTWGAQDPCTDPARANEECVDDRLQFGGSFPWESANLSLSAIAQSQSWDMHPTLAEVRQIVAEIGDSRRVVISIDFRQPYVLDEESGVLGMGAILATLGVRDAAQLDVISGRSVPMGRMPFALPRTVRAVEQQHADAPGYAETSDGALFPYGFGLGY